MIIIILFTLSSHIICFNTISTFKVYAAQAETIYVDQKGNEKDPKLCTVVEATAKTLGSSGQATWYTINKNTDISGRITIKGTVNLEYINLRVMNCISVDKRICQVRSKHMEQSAAETPV